MHFAPFLGAIGVVHLVPDATTFVYHESDDPSWLAIAFRGRSLAIAPKFEADGYANGWQAERGFSFIVVNLAQCSFVVGVMVSLVALTVGLLSLFGPHRVKHGPPVRHATA